MRGVSLLAIGLTLAFVVAADAAPAAQEGRIGASAPTEVSAQSRPRRVRPRILVRPRTYPYRTFHSPYPLPYEAEYPGPGAVRDCRTRLIPEARVSGTVIVPRMRCVWLRP